MIRIHTRACTLLATVCMGAASFTSMAWDEPEASLEAYSTLSMDYVTPHTAWAKPYAQGPLRGYYFIYSRNEGMQTHAREAVELQQRIDLTLDVSYLYNFYREHWFGGSAGERRIARLMSRPHDVFIFQDLSPAKLPTHPLQDGRTPLLAQVRAGAGVVLIGTDDGELFTDAQAITPLPGYLAGTGAVKAYTVGQGRVVQMPARPRIPYRVGWTVEYDYWQEALARAVLWAARREPTVQVQVDCTAQLDRQQLPAKVVTVSWHGATPGETQLMLRLRRWDDQQVVLGTIAAAQADGHATFSMPRSRAGAYHLDAFARSAKGAAGWATRPVEVTATARITALTVASPHPLPERPEPVKNPVAQWQRNQQAMYDDEERRSIYTPYVEVGEAIVGRATAAGVEPGQTLRVSLFDARGRELVRQEMPAKAEQTFRFTAKPWMPALLRVAATLVNNAEEVTSDYRYVRIAQRRQGQFNFVLWDAPSSETLGPYAMERLAEMGVTAILSHKPASLLESAYGMSYVPWTGGSVKGGPGSAEAWLLPSYSEGFAKHMLKSRGSGVLTYSLGDEGAIAGIGEGELTDPVFQAYLKSIYGDIAGLNRSWDTTFNAFNEITVKVAQNVRSPKTTGPLANLARRYDLHYFGGYNFVQMAKRNREATRNLANDPNARIGFEGSGKIGRPGCDPELICRELDMWVPYTGISEEFVRSVAPRTFTWSSWMGYDKDATSFSGHYWRSIMMGGDSIWYWMWSAIGGWMGLQSPNLDAPQPVQAMLDDTRIVREGLGDLLLHYTMQHDGIAVLYSYPDLTAETERRNGSYRSMWAVVAAWDHLIHDLNMQYNFVTERMLLSGELAAGKYKVLVLPRTLCVSEKAAAVIRQFVENGGTVIADVRPAFYNERCKPYAKPILDDLFGVSGGCASAQSSELAIKGNLGLETLTLTRPAETPVLVDPTVALTSGQALGKAGDVPACIINTVGKGRAVLLNFVTHSSFTVRDYEGNLDAKPHLYALPDDAARFFLGLMSEAGVERAFTFTEYKKEKTPFFPNVRVQRWMNGDYQIAGFFRQTDTQPRRGSLLFDSERWPVSSQRKAGGRPYAPFPHVYDIKHGLTVGQADWLITDIAPGSPALYVLLPGPLPMMAVTAPAQAKRGTPVTLTLSVPQARGLHAITLRARMPDGTPATFWDQTVQVDQAPKEVVLPLAFNDPVGTWTLTCTDLFSPETQRTVTADVE